MWGRTDYTQDQIDQVVDLARDDFDGVIMYLKGLYDNFFLEDIGIRRVGNRKLIKTVQRRCG